MDWQSWTCVSYLMFPTKNARNPVFDIIKNWFKLWILRSNVDVQQTRLHVQEPLTLNIYNFLFLFPRSITENNSYVTAQPLEWAVKCLHRKYNIKWTWRLFIIFKFHKNFSCFEKLREIFLDGDNSCPRDFLENMLWMKGLAIDLSHASCSRIELLSFGVWVQTNFPVRTVFWPNPVASTISQFLSFWAHHCTDTLKRLKSRHR